MRDYNILWLDAASETIASYRRMIDGCVEQLSDAELHRRPTANMNSVAVILRHLGGNLRSRWTEFKTTDGEKQDRDRDSEFKDWEGDRASLMRHFDEGWQALASAIRSIDKDSLDDQIFIRGEAHSIPQAITRSLTHVSYHVGQIAMLSRLVHEGEWNWLTIEPGESHTHNRRTWGTAASRTILGEDADSS